MFIQFFKCTKFVRPVIFLQFLSQFLQQDRLIITSKLEHRQKSKRFFKRVIQALRIGAIIVGRVRQFKHIFKSVILHCFALLAMTMHKFIESWLIQYGTLGIVLIVFCHLCQFINSILVVILHFLLNSVKSILDQFLF